MTQLEIMGAAAKKSSRFLMNAGSRKDKALLAIAKALRENSAAIIAANDIDIENGKAAGLTESLLDRLRLDEGRIEGMATGDVALENSPRWPRLKMLEDELRLTGMYLTGHPLSRWRQLFASRVNMTIQEIATLAKKLGPDERRSVKILGMVSSVRVMSGGANAKKGKRSKDWSVIKFADETGEMEACAFSRCHDRISGWIGDAEGVPVLMEGAVSCTHAEGEEPAHIRFALDVITPLDGRVPLDGKLAVEMAYEDEQLVERTIELCKVLKRHPGRTPVCINLKYPTGIKATPYKNFQAGDSPTEFRLRMSSWRKLKTL